METRASWSFLDTIMRGRRSTEPGARVGLGRLASSVAAVSPWLCAVSTGRQHACARRLYCPGAACCCLVGRRADAVKPFGRTWIKNAMNSSVASVLTFFSITTFCTIVPSNRKARVTSQAISRLFGRWQAVAVVLRDNRLSSPGLWPAERRFGIATPFGSAQLGGDNSASACAVGESGVSPRELHKVAAWLRQGAAPEQPSEGARSPHRQKTPYAPSHPTLCRFRSEMPPPCTIIWTCRVDCIMGRTPSYG